MYIYIYIYIDIHICSHTYTHTHTHIYETFSLSIDGYLSFFRVVAVISNAAVNRRV